MTIAQPQRKNPALAGFFVSEVKSSETVMGEFIECEVSKKTPQYFDPTLLHNCQQFQRHSTVTVITRFPLRDVRINGAQVPGEDLLT